MTFEHCFLSLVTWLLHSRCNISSPCLSPLFRHHWCLFHSHKDLGSPESQFSPVLWAYSGRLLETEISNQNSPVTGLACPRISRRGKGIWSLGFRPRRVHWVPLTSLEGHFPLKERRHKGMLMNSDFPSPFSSLSLFCIPFFQSLLSIAWGNQAPKPLKNGGFCYSLLLGLGDMARLLRLCVCGYVSAGQEVIKLPRHYIWRSSLRL